MRADAIRLDPPESHASLTEDLAPTPLLEAHRRASARLVGFAGYRMPVSYPPGVLREHLWTREHAGLFDVSHMGPAFLALDARTGEADADHASIAAVIEPLLSIEVASLAPGQMRYGLLLNASGGIVDDLMVGRPLEDARQGELFLVVNAARKPVDFAMIAQAADGRAQLQRADAGALIALQGPEAAAVLQTVLPEAPRLSFMRHAPFLWRGERLLVSRSGYTGEDGFEILASAETGVALWDRLAQDERVSPIGLGARDSLRLEAGLPLWGQDIDETTSPFEAALGFAVSRRRLRKGALRGAERLAREAAEGPGRLRVGLTVLEGAPAREGAQIADANGEIAGAVTSGGFSPSLGRPIAMGHVPPGLAEPGTRLQVIVRGRPQAAQVVAMPFVPHRYHRPIV